MALFKYKWYFALALSLFNYSFCVGQHKTPCSVMFLLPELLLCFSVIIVVFRIVSNAYYLVLLIFFWQFSIVHFDLCTTFFSPSLSFSLIQFVSLSRFALCLSILLIGPYLITNNTRLFWIRNIGCCWHTQRQWMHKTMTERDEIQRFEKKPIRRTTTWIGKRPHVKILRVLFTLKCAHMFQSRDFLGILFFVLHFIWTTTTTIAQSEAKPSQQTHERTNERKGEKKIWNVNFGSRRRSCVYACVVNQKRLLLSS